MISVESFRGLRIEKLELGIYVLEIFWAYSVSALAVKTFPFLRLQPRFRKALARISQKPLQSGWALLCCCFPAGQLRTLEEAIRQRIGG